MDAEFWKQKWVEGRTAFHQADGNSEFTEYLTRLGDEVRDSKFFFPLCGKTRDMQQVYKLGGEVKGVELSSLAVESYFKESEINFKREDQESFKLYQAERHHIFCGDFFALEAKHLKEITHLFDRASFIALPKELRKKYAEHLKQILPKGVRGLLGLITYGADEEMGPPFSISVEEMKELFHWTKEIKLISQERDEEDNVFADRGVKWLEGRYFEIQYT